MVEIGVNSLDFLSSMTFFSLRLWVLHGQCDNFLQSFMFWNILSQLRIDSPPLRKSDSNV